MEPREAALRGSAEVSFTVISMSLSLIAVFIPILLMPGIVGLLFHEFAVTLSIAILFSLLISLTVTPTMCAYLLGRGDALHSQARWARWAEAQFERFKNAYSRSLSAVLDHALLVGAAADRSDRTECLFVQAGALDVFPGTGQRAADRPDHRRPEHFLPGDGAEAAAAAADRADGSGGRLGDRLYRHPRPQQRQRVCGAQTPCTAAPVGRPGGAAPAAKAQPGLRRAICFCRRSRTCISAAGNRPPNTNTR